MSNIGIIGSIFSGILFWVILYYWDRKRISNNTRKLFALSEKYYADFEKNTTWARKFLETHPDGKENEGNFAGKISQDIQDYMFEITKVQQLKDELQVILNNLQIKNISNQELFEVAVAWAGYTRILSNFYNDRIRDGYGDGTINYDADIAEQEKYYYTIHALYLELK